MAFLCARCGSEELICQECGRVACVGPECPRFVAMERLGEKGYVCAGHRLIWLGADLSLHHARRIAQ